MSRVRDVRIAALAALAAGALALSACSSGSGATAPSPSRTTPAVQPALTTAGAVAAWKDIDARVDAVEALKGKNLAAWDAVEGGVIAPFYRVGSFNEREPGSTPTPKQSSSVTKVWPAPAEQRTAVTLTRMIGGRSGKEGLSWLSVLRQDAPKAPWREIAAAIVDKPPAVGEPTARTVTAAEEKRAIELAETIRHHLLEPPVASGVVPAPGTKAPLFDAVEWKKMCEEGAKDFQCSYGTIGYFGSAPTPPVTVSPALQIVATTTGVLAFASYTIEETGRYPGTQTTYPEVYQPVTGAGWVDHLSYTHGAVVALFIPKTGKPAMLGSTNYQGGPTGHVLN